MKKVCDRASDKKLELMSQAAVMAALTAALTLWLHIPAGLNGGYIHFGDAVISLAAALLPKPYAMAAGAAGSFDSASVGAGHPADQAASRPSLFKRRRADRDQKKYGGSCAGVFSVGIRVLSGRRTDVWFSHGVSCLCLGQRSTVRRERAGIPGSRRRSGSSAGKEEMESRFARVRTRQRLRRKRLWQILCTNTKTRSI